VGIIKCSVQGSVLRGRDLKKVNIHPTTEGTVCGVQRHINKGEKGEDRRRRDGQHSAEAAEDINLQGSLSRNLVRFKNQSRDLMRW